MPRRKDRTEDRMLKKLWKREHKKKEQQKKEEKKIVKNPIPSKVVVKKDEKANPPVKDIVKEIERNDDVPELKMEDIGVEDIIIPKSQPKTISDIEKPKNIHEPEPQLIVSPVANTIIFNNLPKEIKLGCKYNMIYKEFFKKHYHFKHPTKGLPKFPSDAIKIMKNGNVIGFISNRRIKY